MNYWSRPELLNRRSPIHPSIYNFVFSKINLIKKRINFDLICNGLEIGCGNGYFTYQLKKIIPKLIGIDSSSLMLNLCRKINNFDLIIGSGFKLPFKDHSFDLVFSANLIHHVNNPSELIREIKRVTRKYYVLVEPNRNNFLMSLFAFFNKNERNLLKFSLSYLKKLLLVQKFQIIDSFSTGIIAPNKLPALFTTFFKIGDLKKVKFGLYNIIISKNNY